MSEEMNFTPNPGKNLIRAVDGVDYMRIPVKTHLITKDDDMADVVKKYPPGSDEGGRYSLHFGEGSGLYPVPCHPHGGY